MTSGFSLLTTLIGLAILATVATLATTTGHSNAFAFGTLALLEERALARDAAVPVAGMMVGQAAIDRTPLEPPAMPLNGRDYIRGVRMNHPEGRVFHSLSSTHFGELNRYTGY